MARRQRWKCTCKACRTCPRSGDATEHRKLNRALAGLDEKHARRALGLLAEKEGNGGIASLSLITGVSRTTILAAQRELGGKDPVPKARIRRAGGGRLPLEKKDET